MKIIKDKERKKSSAQPSASPVRVVGILQNGSLLDKTLKYNPRAAVDGGERTIVVAGDTSPAYPRRFGVIKAGPYGCAIGGMRCSAETQRQGLAYVQSGTAYCAGTAGIAINRYGKDAIKNPDHPYSAEAANLLAATFEGGNAKMDGVGIAIAINEHDSLDATAQASPGGLIILGYYGTDTNNLPVIKYVPVPVDDVDIKGNTPYKLDSNHKPVKA
jgi:hypothetical protein